MIIGNTLFDTDKRSYIMGILNVTPDSFSDGGKHEKIENALKVTQEMIRQGVDVIDIGGESTRPGHIRISDDEEMSRIVPVIEAIKNRFDIPISLDTYKSKVAEAGMIAGADMINDIWGLKWDGEMAAVVAKYDKACCLMHNRKEMDYSDFLSDVIDDLDESVELAISAGIDRNKLMVDPGIGFAKEYTQNLILMNHLEMLHKWKLPILLGTSRKSMIGLTLDLPVGEREEGTIATSIIGLMKGCSFFRVHDVQANFRALKMADAILKS